jgi:hypothetical protein
MVKVVGCLAVPQSGSPTIAPPRPSPKLSFQSVSASREQIQKPLKLQQLNRLETSIARQAYVMEIGWATMPLAKAPNSDMAMACAKVLNAEG